MKLLGTRSRRGSPTAATRSFSAAQMRRVHPPLAVRGLVFWFVGLLGFGWGFFGFFFESYSPR